MTTPNHPNIRYTLMPHYINRVCNRSITPLVIVSEFESISSTRFWRKKKEDNNVELVLSFYIDRE